MPSGAVIVRGFREVISKNFWNLDDVARNCSTGLVVDAVQHAIRKVSFNDKSPILDNIL
jgi:hypothetical protein